MGMDRDLFFFEKKYSQYSFIAGLDEAGRGAWAGPVVAAAVIMPKDLRLNGVNDSKLLSEARREELFTQITHSCVAYGVGLVDAAEIDAVNILVATKKAMLIAVSSLSQRPDFLMIDGKGMELATEIPQVSIIDGDALSHTIAAASIIAKVTRDRLMKDFAQTHPQYGFERHKGYGTKLHQQALKNHGVLGIHRKSYEPVRKLL